MLIARRLRRMAQFAAMMCFLLSPGALHAQAQLPDSVVVLMTSPALFRLVGDEMARASIGFHHVMRVEVPRGQLWSRVAAHILAATNGRTPSSSDDNVTVVGIRDIVSSSDTLTATVYHEVRFRCPNGGWVTTGTEYRAHAGRVAGGWTQITMKPGVTWDAGVCDRSP